jgi:hypothetical protein
MTNLQQTKSYHKRSGENKAHASTWSFGPDRVDYGDLAPRTRVPEDSACPIQDPVKSSSPPWPAIP